jgi:hypothetical protein
MKKSIKSIIAAISVGAIIGVSMVGCSSQADVASKNLSTSADNFEVQREIRGVNTRTGAYLFEVTGRCSIDRESQDYVVTCKQGPNDYRKHFLSRSNDTSIVVAQLAPINVDTYHTRIILKPENLIPEIDLQTSMSK